MPDGHTWFMTENSTPTAPAPRSWRIPALVALVVVVIAVVVTIVVRHGDDNSSGPATDASTTSSPTSDSPSDAMSSSDSSSPSTSPTMAPSVLPGVDLDGTLKKALKAKFPALIPSEVPAGWTLTDVSWDGQLWVLDFAVPGGGTAQVFQIQATEKALVDADLAGAQSDGTVNLKKFGTGTWNAWQGGSEYGLTHKFAKTMALVVAPDKATAVTIAQQLLTAEDGQLTDDD
jgi:hypothetical protein